MRGTVEISTTQVRMISGNEDYYTTHFSADELYWLPHIAYVEALEEPLAGIMGVVSVVLNRVEDDDFPDTIFEVLYDSRTAVQFTPPPQAPCTASPLSFIISPPTSYSRGTTPSARAYTSSTRE